MFLSIDNGGMNGIEKLLLSLSSLNSLVVKT